MPMTVTEFSSGFRPLPELRHIVLPEQEIVAFCDRWQVSKLSLFGSVLRDDFRPDSDIDVMVEFLAIARPSFASLDTMRTELEVLFEREVDLITHRGIQASQNYLRRNEILSSAQVIYESGSSVPA